MKILVTGSNGQLGTELMLQGAERGHKMSGFDIPELDISDYEKISDIIKKGCFDIVINAAAYTAVDLAETETEKAEKANVKGPANIALACSESGIPMIHVSTDYVFNGLKKEPYTETDLPDPIGIYGITKLNGEKSVAEILPRHIIVRTAWVYGVKGKNFVKTMLNLGKDREELRVVSDQTGCPTYCADLAGAILTAAERSEGIRKADSPEMGRGISANVDDSRSKDEIWGTYHYCGSGKTTWHGFAEAIFEEARKYEDFKVKKIHAITTEEYPTPAKRPASSVLDCSKFSETFGVSIPEWRNSLNSMIRRLYSK